MSHVKFEEVHEEKLKNPKYAKKFWKRYQASLVGEVVTGLMQEQKISVREMARLTEFSTNTIFKVMQGKGSSRINTLTKILDILGCQLQIVRTVSEDTTELLYRSRLK